MNKFIPYYVVILYHKGEELPYHFTTYEEADDYIDKNKLSAFVALVTREQDGEC